MKYRLLNLTTYLKSEVFLILFLAATLLVLGLVFPNSIAKGKLNPDPPDYAGGNWGGTLEPTANDIDTYSPQITVANNSELSQYEAKLNTNGSGYFIRSVVIAPSTGTLDKWKQLKLGIRRPSGTNTTLTVDIVCGDAIYNCGGSAYNQPITGYQNIPLSISDDYDIPTSLTYNKIKIRVNFSSADVTQPQAVLYSWQVSWLVNSGVNLVVTKTTGSPIANTANPEFGNGVYPGANNYNTVVYFLNYSLDKSVTNLKLELPFPAGTYTPTAGSPKTYTAYYLGSSGGQCYTTADVLTTCPGGNKVVFNLGDLPADTTGSVNVTFKILMGAPAIVFKTKAKISGANISTATLPDDSLNIESKGYARANLIGPEYVAPNTEVSYALVMGETYYNFQSDLFNAKYEFTYPSTCLENSDTAYPKVSGSGAASVNISRVNRKITFNLASPVVGNINAGYSVTLKSSGSCGTSVDAALTIYSDQDINNNFVSMKQVTVKSRLNQTPIWDSTSAQKIYVYKNGGPNPVGAGQRADYNIRMEQRSTVPIPDFYVIDQIPADTTFISAYLVPGAVYTTNGSPKNNWKTYWSNSATLPGRSDASWTEFSGSPLCPGNCTVASGSEGNVKWVKWDVGVGNKFYFDINYNWDQPMAKLSVVTSTSASGTIHNYVRAYTGATCINIIAAPSTPCPIDYPITVSNLPYFSLSNTPYNIPTQGQNSCASGYGSTNPAVVNAGEYYCSTGFVENSFDNYGISNGDATDVTLAVTLPDRQYLDDTNPFITTGNNNTYMRCVMNSGESSTCPINSAGTLGNATWLYTVNNSGGYGINTTGCPTGAGSGSCVLTWKIPKIYAQQKYPQTLPYRYNFYIRVNTSTGTANQTSICLSVCKVEVTSSTPNNPKLNTMTYGEVKIASSINLNFSKTANKTAISCDPVSRVTYTLGFQHATTGATSSVANLFVMDALPELSLSELENPTRLYFVSADSGSMASGDVAMYYMTNRSRSGNPPSSTDANWQAFPVPAGQEPIVDWVMWKKLSPFLTTDLPQNVRLTLKDQTSCTPNGKVYTNWGAVGWNVAGIDNPLTRLCNSNNCITTTIVNPGFITTSKGNIGSSSNIDFTKTGENIAILDSATSKAGGLLVNSYSWNHTVGSNNNRLLLVGVSIRGGGPPYPIVASISDTSPTSTQSLVSANAVSSTGGVRTEFWYLKNPDPGVNTLTITFSGSVPWGSVAGSSSWYNVDQTTPINHVNTYNANGYGSSQSVSMTNSVDDIVVDVLSMPNGATDVASPASSQSSLWNLYSGGDTKGAGSYKSGSTNTTMTWNLKTQAGVAKNEYWALSAVSIKGASTSITPVSSTDYLGIATTSINTTAFQSAKNWLLTSYAGLPSLGSSSSYPNYAKMFADYSREAKPCSNESECLKNDSNPNPDTDKVKIFNATAGNPLVINSTSIYRGVPRIIFVNSVGQTPEEPALVMNSNFSINADSAVIFVVKGNVKVSYGVTEIAGAYLVDGQFSTGTRSSTNAGTADAGKFAAISTGQDGFARIAYLSGDNVRFIKCKDLDCITLDYGYVTTVDGASVTSLNMDLYPVAANVDYPKIVVSQVDTSANPAIATTKFINCSSEDCLSNNTIVYPDVKDADILVDNGFPSFAVGSGASSPRSSRFASCWPDPACANPTLSQIDGGSGNSQDKGNELNYSIDTTVPDPFPDQLVATYVDRSTLKSDLWMAKYNWSNAGTGCYNTTLWDCQRISGSSPGNVGLFPTSLTHPTRGETKTSYLNSSTKEIRYLSCNDKPCTAKQDTMVIDCSSAAVCEGKPYLSSATLASNYYSLYNTRRENPANPGQYLNEVKLGHCWSISNCGSSAVVWATHNISNYVINNAEIYNQSLALGKVTEVGFPRIVFYNSEDKALYYVRCKTNNCDSAANMWFKKIDGGNSIALKDTQLTIKGSVIAFGNNVTTNKAIKLERDLFNTSTTQPGEILIMEPKYFYILKDVVKTPKDIIKDSPP